MDIVEFFDILDINFHNLYVHVFDLDVEFVNEYLVDKHINFDDEFIDFVLVDIYLDFDDDDVNDNLFVFIDDDGVVSRWGRATAPVWNINTMKQTAIIGMGIVGQGMLHIFPDAYQFDEPRGIGTRDGVNECDLAVVCVPSPSREDGFCDTSIVEEVISWIECPLILIKSAVEPGTTERLMKQYEKRIVVSPEYMGESKYFIPDRFLDPKNPLKHEFLILGGKDRDCEEVADIFAPKVGAVTRIRFMSATEAEVVKYAENTFFATKVTFANELREICEALGASWHRVREGWIDDPRIGAMHTAVFKDDRGFGGKCYPKDLLALLRLAETYNVDTPLIRGVIDSNAKRRTQT